MKLYSYKDIKSDIASIVNEVVESSGTVRGGLSSAINEYWIDHEVLIKNHPTPYAVKLLAAISIAFFMRKNKIELGSLRKSSEWIIEHMSTKDVFEIEKESQEHLIVEASSTFGDSIASKLKTKVSSVA